MKRLLVVLLLLMLCGCTKTARLYNLDTGEVSIVKYSDRGTGHGLISGQFKSGETFQGEYSTVAGGTMAWGSIYSSVYTPVGSASSTSTAFTNAVEGKQKGAGIITGDKGTILDCEYAVSALSGHGAGACKDQTLERI